MSEPTPAPLSSPTPDMTLGELLNHAIADENSREHNRRVIERAAARSSIEAYAIGAQVAALEACDPYTRFPMLLRLRAYANNEFGRDLTPEAVRRIRGRVCEALDIDTVAADALLLARVVEILRDASGGGPSDRDAPNPYRWLRVTDVAKLFAISAGHVSRLADDSTFVTNGLSGQERRVDALSVIRWFLTRPERQDQPSEAADADD